MSKSFGGVRGCRPPWRDDSIRAQSASASRRRLSLLRGPHRECGNLLLDLSSRTRAASPRLGQPPALGGLARYAREMRLAPGARRCGGSRSSVNRSQRISSLASTCRALRVLSLTPWRATPTAVARSRSTTPTRSGRRLDGGDSDRHRSATASVRIGRRVWASPPALHRRPKVGINFRQT